MVTERIFGNLPSGEESHIYHIENAAGAYIEVSQYGAILVNVCVPDKDGRLTDVVLGYDDLESYFVNGCFFGACIGRSGNRIADSRFMLDGTEIKAIIVDPAAASFIAELRKRGYRVLKAKNDVEDGIRLVSTMLNLLRIVFADSCENTIMEFGSYIWDAKAAEYGEDRPVKQHDHAMDAVRYFVFTILGNKPHLNRVKGGV